jgi:hypothetical protein
VGSKALVTQSGVQATYGGMSASGVIDSLAAEVEAQLVKKIGKEKTAKAMEEARREQSRPEPSVLVILAALALGFGALCGLTLRPWRVRCTLVAASGLLAGILLLTQHAIGFPLEDAIGRNLANELLKDALAGRSSGKSSVAAALLIDVNRTGWFWAAVAACFAAPGLGVIERFWRGYRVERANRAGSCSSLQS